MSEQEAPVTKSPGSLLADEMYAEPEPVAQHATPEPVIEETVDEPVLQEAEAEVETDEAPPDVETEEIEVSSVEQLAEHLEADPEWIQSLEITQKVNGKEVPVKLSDALTTHRKVKAADTYLADAKTKAKSMIEEANTQQEQLNSAVVTAGTLIKAVEDQIETDIAGIDWDGLRRQDPAEYSAKKEEVRERRDKLKALRDDALSGYQQMAEQVRRQEEAARQAQLPHEQEILFADVPEWADDEVAGKEKAELVQYLQERGYQQEEIEYLSYRGIAMGDLVWAMRARKAKGKADTAKKRVVKIPKVLKPGANKGEQPSKPKTDDPVSILYGS